MNMVLVMWAFVVNSNLRTFPQHLEIKKNRIFQVSILIYSTYGGKNAFKHYWEMKGFKKNSRRFHCTRTLALQMVYIIADMHCGLDQVQHIGRFLISIPLYSSTILLPDSYPQFLCPSPFSSFCVVSLTSSHSFYISIPYQLFCCYIIDNVLLYSKSLSITFGTLSLLDLCAWPSPEVHFSHFRRSHCFFSQGPHLSMLLCFSQQSY